MKFPMNKRDSLLLLLFSLSISTVLFSQQAGWLTVTDDDKNSYYVSQTGKIFTSEKPDFSYKAVSFQGIEYYLEQGESLLVNHHKVRGLLLLKSLRLLGSADSRAAYSSYRASARINDFQMQEGDRFPAYNRAASLLLYQVDGRSTLFSDYLSYGCSVLGDFSVVKRSVFHGDRFKSDSVVVGVRFSEKSDNKRVDGEGYDALLAVTSVDYRYARFRTVDAFEQSLIKRVGNDSYERSVVNERDGRRLVALKNRGAHATVEKQKVTLKSAPLSSKEGVVERGYFGYELIVHGERRGVRVQIIAPNRLLENDKKMATLIESFSFSL